MTRRTRLTAAVAGLGATVLALSGCTLTASLTGAGETSDPDSLEVIDPQLPEGLRSYYEQNLEWGACPAEYGYESDRECATASAPMNWEAPGEGEDVQLAMVRIHATGKQPEGSLFTNPGGPGASGMDMVGGYGENMVSKDLLEHYDLVSWDPRGVGYSSAVKCLDDAGMDNFFYGVPDPVPTTTAGWDDANAKVATEFGEACANHTGELLGFVDTESTAHDLDLLRALVGDSGLNYFGFSYGTDIGEKYVDAYPERVRRVVLDSAMDPTVSNFDTAVDQEQKFADATRAYLTDCLQSTSCPFTGSVDDAIQQMQDINDEADDLMPATADGRKFTSSVISTAINASMYDESSWPYLTSAYSAWNERMDSSVFFALADDYNGRDANGHYAANMFQAYYAISCLDYPRVTDPAAIEEYQRKLNEVTLFKSSSEEFSRYGDVMCENWPVEPRVKELKPAVGAGAAPVLVVNTTNDPATPLKWAEAVADQLDSGVLVTLEGEGHIAYDEHNACLVGAVDNYLVDGTVPEDGLKCS